MFIKHARPSDRCCLSATLPAEHDPRTTLTWTRRIICSRSLGSTTVRSTTMRLYIIFGRFKDKILMNRRDDDDDDDASVRFTRPTLLLLVW